MDEIVKVIKIESDGAEQTVAGLVNEIKSLTEAMNGVQKGTEEYTNILKDLIDNQDKLSKAMKTSKQETTAAEGSYNALVKQMAALKKQWRETTDEASRKELGKEIKSINNKLKDMDASIGDFRRNVGNYAGSIKDAFGMMGGAAKGMIGPLNSVKGAFTALSAHPLVAVLTALAALLINGVAKGFKNSEEASNKMKVAFSALQGIADSVYKAFEKVALWIANVTEKTVKLLDWLGLLSPELKKSMEDRKKIAEDEIKLDDKKRDNIKKNADLEKEAAELRAQAADKSKYTAEERLKFLEEAEQKEQEIAANDLEALELEYKIAEAKLKINQDNAELKQQEAEAYAAYNKALTDYNEKLKASKTQINKTRKEIQRNTEQAASALLKLERDLIQQEYNLAAEGSEKQLQLAKELAAKDREIAINDAKSKIEDKNKLNKALLLIDKEYYQKLEKLEFQAESKRIANKETRLNLDADSILDLVKRAEAKFNAAATILEEKRNQLAKMTDKSSQDFIDLENDIKSREIALVSLQDNFYQALEQQADTHAKYIFETTIPVSQAYHKLIHELEVQVANLKKGSTETQEAFELRKKALKDYINDSRKAWMEAIAMEKRVVDEYNKLTETFEKFNDKTRKKWLREGWLLWFSNDLGTELDKARDVAVEKFRNMEDVIRGEVMTNSENIAKALKSHLFSLFNSMSYEDFEKHPLFDWRTIFGIDKLDDLNGDALEYAMVRFRDTDEIKAIFSELFKEGLLSEETMNEYLQSLENLVDSEKAILQQRYENWNELGKGIADIMGGISDIYSIKLENEKKALEKEGKYTEKERKNLEERYKTVQAMQIAEATINTISGAVAAFMKCQELGQPWGAIIGAVQAAAVTAAGVAQIMKIKQTNPYSDNSSSLSSGDGMMSATVQPTVSDYNPQYSQNLTGRSDIDYLNEALGKTRLVVSVSEINEVQNRVRVVESESQF